MKVSEVETANILPEGVLLPWHVTPWQALLARRHNDTLPHALLLTGPRGLGKNRFADSLTQALLCGQPQVDGQACTVCRSCLLYQAGTHPDYLQVRPGEEGKAIVVDQIRTMNTHLALKSQYAGHKLVVISPAEQMNTAAANSLLKTLEEPAAHSLLILITGQPAQLLPTVRSRCQQIKFSAPPEHLAASWLKPYLKDNQNLSQLLALAGGAPLAALSMAASDALAKRAAVLGDLGKLLTKQADPVMLAASWLQGNVLETLTWMLSYNMDMIRLRGAAHPPYLANPDLQQSLKVLAERFSLPMLYRRLDCVTEAIRLLNRQINIQLLLEDMLLSWNDISSAHCRTSYPS